MLILLKAQWELSLRFTSHLAASSSAVCLLICLHYTPEMFPGWINSFLSSKVKTTCKYFGVTWLGLIFHHSLETLFSNINEGIVCVETQCWLNGGESLANLCFSLTVQSNVLKPNTPGLFPPVVFVQIQTLRENQQVTRFPSLNPLWKVESKKNDEGVNPAPPQCVLFTFRVFIVHFGCQ